MAVLDLSLVTDAFLRLIERGINTSPEWPSPGPLATVVAHPPDRLGGDFTVGFYLYSITEDPHHKNAPAPGDQSLPLQFTPMPLQLYYLLTAHSDLAGDASTTREQLMMGLAMKALRDQPYIDENSFVGPVRIFSNALVGRGNKFRITLHPTTPHDAVQYWTAGSQPLRLSVHYHVSVVFLEPDRPTAPGRVLSYGVHSLLRGAPHLDHSLNRVAYTLPDGTTPTVVLRPAEAALGGDIEFRGSELTDDETRLLIQHSSWAQPIEADASTWGVTASASFVLARVAEFAGTEPVLPGQYFATVVAVSNRTMPGGAVRRFETPSNQVPFAVAPRIDALAFPGTLSGRSFNPAILTGDAIQMFIGVDRLTRITPNPPPPAPPAPPAGGQFQVIDNTTIQFRVPATAVSGSVVPVRLIVRGVESAPRWETLP